MPDGDIANFAVVAARNENGDCHLYLVDLGGDEGGDGLTVETLNSIDPSRSLAKISFNGAAATPLGSPKDGEQQLLELIDKAAILFAFEQIGGCQAAMEMGMAYTKERYAFGRPVASFQAIKHKFADMFVALELAKSNAYYGA